MRFLLIYAAATMVAPPEPVAGQLNAAIWSDLQLNAMIGNGNWIASLWYNAGDGSSPDLHIRDLECRKRGPGMECAFELVRDGGTRTVAGEPAPDRLSCTAFFIRAEDRRGWAVMHTPPKRVGHSRTSMACATS